MAIDGKVSSHETLLVTNWPQLQRVFPHTGLVPIDEKGIPSSGLVAIIEKVLPHLGLCPQMKKVFPHICPYAHRWKGYFQITSLEPIDVKGIPT